MDIHGSGAGDGPGEGDAVGAVERQDPAIGHVARDGAGGPAHAELKGAGTPDRGSAGIEAVAGQDFAGARGDCERTRPRDRPCVGVADPGRGECGQAGDAHRGRAVVAEPVDRLIGRDAQVGAAREADGAHGREGARRRIGERRRSAGNRGGARVGVGPRKGHRSAHDIDAARAGNDAWERDAVGAVERERAVIGHVARDRSGGRGVPELEDARAGDRRPTGVVVRPRQDLRRTGSHIK